MENTCLNCKHWEPIKEYPGDGICTNNSAFKSLSEVSTDADFFCKYFESNSIHLETLKVDNTETYEGLDNLKKEFAESGLSMDDFLKLKVNEYWKNEHERIVKNFNEELKIDIESCIKRYINPSKSLFPFGNIIFKNPCKNDTGITQKVKLVNFDDLTDEFKEKYFK